MPKCRYCGEGIDFVRTRNGKMMPVQARGVYARADAAGRRWAYDIEGNFIRVSEARKGEPGTIIARFPHWQFCPGAEAARVTSAPEPPKAPEPEPQRTGVEQTTFLEEEKGYGTSTRGQYWRL